MTDRRQRIVARLVGDDDSGLHPERLCEVCAEVTGVSGAGVMLMADDTNYRWMDTHDPVTALIEQLQITLGEGPGVDAHLHGVPVFEPDLDDPDMLRWPAFSETAAEFGVRAVFGFPIRVGGVRLGALDLHSIHPGMLKTEQHLDALVLANVVAEAILLIQAGASPVQLAAELRSGADFENVVNQAAGMVAVQLNVSVGSGLVRLREFAFDRDRPLADVAREIVDRRVRFEP